MTRHIFFVLLCALTINAQAASPDELCREAWGWVKQEYFQPVDEQAFFAVCPTSLGTVLNKHSELIQRETAAGDRDYFGAIGLELKLEDGMPKVLEAFESFPAAQSQVQRNDRILEIDGISVTGLSLAEITKRLRGEVGSTVTLTLRRDGKTITTPAITRRIIKLPTVISKEIQPGFLWIRVARFETSSIRDVVDKLMERRRAKEKEAIKGLIFDFRGNPGGRLDAALALAAAFLPEEAPLIRIQEQGGKERIIMANDRNAFNRAQISRLPPDIKSLPIIALMNQNSAAGPEIVAGTWQGYGKALVMGLPSFGKHTIETVRQMQSQPDAYLKLTTAAWTYLDGRSVAGQGLVPDVRFDGDTDVVDPSDAIVAQALSKLKVR